VADKELAQIATENLVICPDCGTENIEGSDYCVNCHADLQSVDKPRPENDLEARLMETPVASIPLRPAIALTPDDSLLTAIQAMQAQQTGAVVVLDQERLAGVFTERDLVMRMAAGDDLDRVKLREVMTPNPFYLRSDTRLAHAIHQMAVGDYRHLPVLEEEQVVGLASLTSIFEFVYEALNAKPLPPQVERFDRQQARTQSPAPAEAE
jgi:CBS domain-containing protein